MKTKLTEEDILNLDYFWRAKGRLDCGIDWAELRPLLIQRYPQVVEAWEKYEKAVKEVTTSIDDMIEHSTSISP